ncbi:hypothetical protein Tco_0081588, partial [Tanacetum coccineum]
VRIEAGLMYVGHGGWLLDCEWSWAEEGETGQGNDTLYEKRQILQK